MWRRLASLSRHVDSHCDVWLPTRLNTNSLFWRHPRSLVFIYGPFIRLLLSIFGHVSFSLSKIITKLLLPFTAKTIENSSRSVVTFKEFSTQRTIKNKWKSASRCWLTLSLRWRSQTVFHEPSKYCLGNHVDQTIFFICIIHELYCVLCTLNNSRQTVVYFDSRFSSLNLLIGGMSLRIKASQIFP